MQRTKYDLAHGRIRCRRVEEIRVTENQSASRVALVDHLICLVGGKLGAEVGEDSPQIIQPYATLSTPIQPLEHGLLQKVFLFLLTARVEHGKLHHFARHAGQEGGELQLSVRRSAHFLQHAPAFARRWMLPVRQHAHEQALSPDGRPTRGEGVEGCSELGNVDRQDRPASGLHAAAR